MNRLGKLNAILKEGQFFDLPASKDFPTALRTMIPHQDKDFSVSEQVIGSTFPLKDDNMAEDFSPVATIKRVLKNNPFGISYTGELNSKVDLKLISILQDLENDVKAKTGETVSILNGAQVNSANFAKAMKILKDFKPSALAPAATPDSKERVSVTSVTPAKDEEKNKEITESTNPDQTVKQFQKLLGVEETGIIDEDTKMAAEAVEFKIAELTKNNAAKGLLFNNGKFKTTPADLQNALKLIQTHKKALLTDHLVKKYSNLAEKFYLYVNSEK